jgi:hypothetical protein
VTQTNPAWVRDPNLPIETDSPYSFLGCLQGKDALYVFVEGPGEPNRWLEPPPPYVATHIRIATPSGAAVAFRGGGRSQGSERHSLIEGEFDRPPAETEPLSVELDVGDEAVFASGAIPLSTPQSQARPSANRIWLVVDDASRHGDPAYRVLGGVEGRDLLYLCVEGPGWQPPPGPRSAGPNASRLQLRVLRAGEPLEVHSTGSGTNRGRSLVKCAVDRPGADVLQLDVVLTVDGVEKLAATVTGTLTT